jgi:cell division protein FtsB
MATTTADRAARRLPLGDRARTASAVGGVRWDRITRWALLALVAVLLLLYVSPMRSYFGTTARAGQEQQKLQNLRAEHERLIQRRNALRAPGAVELEARRRGMVKPGEQAFVVTGLSANNR